MDLNSVAFVAGTLGLVLFVWLNAHLGAAILRQTESLPNLLLNPLEVVGRVGFVGACIFLGWVSGLSPGQLGWTIEDLGLEIAIGLGAAAVLQQLNHWGTRWAVNRCGPGIYSSAFLRAMVPSGTREWVLSVVAIFPGALAEELLFRSLVIGGFAVFASPLLLAVVFSAVFGLVHLPQGRLGVVGAGALGLILSLLFLWRWNIVACVVAHYCVNLVQLARARRELEWFEGV